MAGFILKNTLSENGGVTRGVCKLDEKGLLADVIETSDIVKTATGASANGATIDPESYVSMNFWGFPGNPPAYMSVLAEGFEKLIIVRDCKSS